MFNILNILELIQERGHYGQEYKQMNTFKQDLLIILQLVIPLTEIFQLILTLKQELLKLVEIKLFVKNQEITKLI